MKSDHVRSLWLSPCPNDTFMFDGWVNGRTDREGLDVEVTYRDIEELNRAVREGIPDISKISCALLPAIRGSYDLLACGAALGRGNGPLLVCRSGDAARPLRRVAVPGLQTTACALLRRLFPEAEPVPLLFSEIAAAVERGGYDAGVLIHEGRFTYRRHRLALVADLGLLWEERTGLPLPLGAIVIRRSLGPELKARAERVLRRSIAYAFDHPEASRPYVKTHAREMDDAVIDSHIALFVNAYSLDLGAEGRRALEELAGI